MSYLLDSHILYWLRTKPETLSEKIRSILEDVNIDVYYSVVTPWELSIKHAKGKLPLPKDFFKTLPTLGFACLPIEETHIDALRELPDLHGDPFDRMLVAQAKCEKLTFITTDKKMKAYPIKTLIA